MKPILCSNVKCKRTLEETWHHCPYCGTVPPVADPPCDSKDVHATETPKPPYGWKHIERSEYNCAAFCDSYRVEHGDYIRQIDAGPGFRLLREEEKLPELLSGTRDGVFWEQYWPAGFGTVAGFVGQFKGVLAIRVPCEPPPPDLAREQRIAHVRREWMAKYAPFDDGSAIYSIARAVMKDCARAHVEAMEKLEVKPVPVPWKPISDLSGLPESGNVLAYYKAIGEWLNTSTKHLEHDAITHWMPMPPQPPPPVPAVKTLSDEDAEREAFMDWRKSETKPINDLDIYQDAFRAGIAHARREGKIK